eukprot:tig00000194_g14793.t1
MTPNIHHPSYGTAAASGSPGTEAAVAGQRSSAPSGASCSSLGCSGLELGHRLPRGGGDDADDGAPPPVGAGHARARRHWADAFIWAYGQNHKGDEQHVTHVASVAEVVLLLQRFSGEHLLHIAHSPVSPGPAPGPSCACGRAPGPSSPCGSADAGERAPLLGDASEASSRAAPGLWRRLMSRDSAFVRSLVVLLSCLMCVGPAHEYDVVGALEQQVEQALSITPTRFAWLYMIYPIPNIVLVFLGGVAIDVFGLRGSSLVFSGCVALGASSSRSLRSFAATLVGRVIYAMGSETTYIIKSSILMRWFPGNSRAISLSVSFIRLGSVFAFTLLEMPRTFSSAPGARRVWGALDLTSARRRGSSAVAGLTGSKLLAPVWFAASSCLLCFASALLYVLIDVTTERNAKRRGAPTPTRPRPSLWAALHLPPRYWALMACGIALYSAVWPFQSYSTHFLHTMYGMDVNTARWVTSIIPFMSLTLSLPAGWLVDRLFKHHLLVLASCLVAVPCFLVPVFAPAGNPFPCLQQPTSPRLSFLPASPPCLSLPLVPAVAFVAYTFIGLLFTLYVSSLFPAIAVIVDPSHFGVAYGLTSAGINFGLLTSYQVVGLISEHGGGPRATLVYYGFWSCVACAAALAWCLMPSRAPAADPEPEAEAKATV